MHVVVVAALACALLSSCVPIVDNSNPAAGISPIKGFGNPEDLVHVTGTDWLIVSEFRHREQKMSGKLTFYRASDGLRKEAQISLSINGDSWGDRDCSQVPPRAEDFRPHGIDIVKRGDLLHLLVINHHRESDIEHVQERIDLFEVSPADDGQGIPALSWRGCVTMPENTRPNDVAALPDSEGFVVSNMGYSWVGLKTAFGLDTGEVWAWGTDRWNCSPTSNSSDHWCKIPGSAATLPNGVAVSPDGKRLYFAAYGEWRVIRISSNSKEPQKSKKLPITPDNLTWSGDGQLLAVGSTVHPARLWPCRKSLESGFCGAPFKILAIDPKDLTACVVEAHDGKSAMGFPSVALEFGDALYLGTATGDRIARVDKPGGNLCY